MFRRHLEFLKLRKIGNKLRPNGCVRNRRLPSRHPSNMLNVLLRHQIIFRKMHHGSPACNPQKSSWTYSLKVVSILHLKCPKLSQFPPLINRLYWKSPTGIEYRRKSGRILGDRMLSSLNSKLTTAGFAFIIKKEEKRLGGQRCDQDKKKKGDLWDVAACCWSEF